MCIEIESCRYPCNGRSSLSMYIFITNELPTVTRPLSSREDIHTEFNSFLQLRHINEPTGKPFNSRWGWLRTVIALRRRTATASGRVEFYGGFLPSRQPVSGRPSILPEDDLIKHWRGPLPLLSSVFLPRFATRPLHQKFVSTPVPPWGLSNS